MRLPVIKEMAGDILDAQAEALVNTVNTVGVMGKGIALQFRQAFPAIYEEYRKACERGEVTPGRMFVVPTERLVNPKFIINFPTKRHWKGKSRIDDIKAGLGDLVRVVKKLNIRSIAVPPLGCGSGGLSWDDVRPMIIERLSVLEDVEVLLFSPHGSPDPDKMKVATARPNMTLGRAALLSVMKEYRLPGYRLSMLEIQKLAYFLQCSGVNLRLTFVKAKYGPYAEALHHVLQRIEGHFIRGYGDRSQSASIVLLPDSDREAEGYLKNSDDGFVQAKVCDVIKLIEEFETPYGLELLATVHWVAQQNKLAESNPEIAVDGVLSWNEHKKKTFKREHILIAWERLAEKKWLAS